VTSRAPVRPRNDPRQYDDLAEEWWRPGGAFTALHWLAEARARLIPPANRPGAVLVDVACGGGLLAPHVHGYRHVGVDLGEQAVRVARDHGVETVRGDVHALPVADASADVVVAGEILEHVPDVEPVLAECARVLRPGGTFVCDTLAATRICRFLMVTVAERVPGVAPKGIHDPAYFVDPRHLQDVCARHGIPLAVSGLRPSIPDGLAWLARRRAGVRMLPTRNLDLVYQGVGVKETR
jgi:2-polyprenyl-6-hydroxyphenyl methylase / 3-demethylubiquinone-9 3-methyltransferase